MPDYRPKSSTLRKVEKTALPCYTPGMGDYSEFIIPEIREIESVLRSASAGQLRLVGVALPPSLLVVDPQHYYCASVFREGKKLKSAIT